ncbi:GntR family transcriptional regulator [Georgenia sp. Z1491]|uniref:GntR family transcriptional regulator n=1 Tax=Georgenia sp. Z1491 TaxID=3416707 RepID=UPI003CED8118
MTVRDRTASARIVAGLRERILAGELRPGDRVRQEEVAEDFGASRLPVRDALRHLEAEGLVRLVASSGAWVASLSLQECTDAYLIREQVEPLLIEQSLPHLDAEAIDRLDELADEMEGADLQTFLKLDREFHLLSFSAARPGMVIDLVHRLWNTTQHYRRAYALLVGDSRDRTTTAEHRLLVDAARRRSVTDAQAVQRMHVRRTRLALAEHPELFDAD